MLQDARLALERAGEDDIDKVKSAFLGKKGRISLMLRNIGSLSASERQDAGQRLNKLRQGFEELLEKRKNSLREKALEEKLGAEGLDVTLPGRDGTLGSRHPVTLVTERATRIFVSMGFAVADGPEIEDDFHNFEALNHPEDHPARSMHDTFYLGDGRLLRTHTSPVQIRYMQKHAPPLRVIAPGKVYRVDNDATHSPMFHQIEGLWVDGTVRFSDLKGLLLAFYREMFEDPDIDIRFRPSYFPFTEPSAEVDIRFGRESWLEVAGCGMVHPNVLEASGVDSNTWQGFAFGTGIDRIAMLRYGIEDIRALYTNDLRFLRSMA